MKKKKSTDTGTFTIYEYFAAVRAYKKKEARKQRFRAVLASIAEHWVELLGILVTLIIALSATK